MAHRKECKGDSQEHRDALAIVDFIFNEGGSTRLSNPELAQCLGFTKRYGNVVTVDEGRFYRARNHARDRVDKGSSVPCTGYGLHYRDVKGKPHWALLDPKGKASDLALAGIETLRGWSVREAQHHTENQRQVVTFERLGDQAFANGDKDGYRLCMEAIIELQREGTVSDALMAQLQIWAASL